MQAEAATLAASLVPPFLLEGQSAARGAVASALIEFKSAESALEIAGKAAGKSFGAGLMDEIDKAIKVQVSTKIIKIIGAHKAFFKKRLKKETNLFYFKKNNFHQNKNSK